MRREKFSRAIFALFLLFFIWALLQFLGPIVLPEKSIRDLSGFVCILDNKEITEKLPFPFNLVYACGDLMCHQKAERSFFINNNQMPFCVRCTAIWLGLALGIGLMIFYKFELNQKSFILIVAAIAPLMIDGLGQFVGLWTSTNLSRFATGIIAGLACGFAVVFVIEELSIIINDKNKLI